MGILARLFLNVFTWLTYFKCPLNLTLTTTLSVSLTLVTLLPALIVIQMADTRELLHEFDELIRILERYDETNAPDFPSTSSGLPDIQFAFPTSWESPPMSAQTSSELPPSLPPSGLEEPSDITPNTGSANLDSQTETVNQISLDTPSITPGESAVSHIVPESPPMSAQTSSELPPSLPPSRLEEPSDTTPETETANLETRTETVISQDTPSIAPGEPAVSHIVPETASCCECSTTAEVTCAQCDLTYCKSCSERVHKFFVLASHTPSTLDTPVVEISSAPLPPLEDLVSYRSTPLKYFSVDKLLAFQQGALHGVRRSTLPYPDITQYHLLYDFFYNEVDVEGFINLKNMVGGMVGTCRSRADVTSLLQCILDTLLARKKRLSALVRRHCVELRDGPQPSLGSDKLAEGSFHRVVRANQLFVQSLYALVRDEVLQRGNLQRDYLMEDVAEILLISRHLFYPHKLIKRTPSSG